MGLWLVDGSIKPEVLRALRRFRGYRSLIKVWGYKVRGLDGKD